MEPWQSWGIALVGGGLVYLYYTSQSQSKPARQRGDTQRKDPKTRTKADGSVYEPSGSDAAKAPVKEDQSAKTGSKKRKAGKQKAEPATQSAPAAVPARGAKEPEAEDDDDNNNDKEWAQQMANAKKGTTLAAPARHDSRLRTVKQSGSAASPAFSSASSTAGIDADDDMTPAVSPNLAAGDVSDMLEPTKKGPSILRLTEPANPQQQRQPRPAKEFQPAESKKQRQNRRKVEEKRIAREAEENQRQALLETQRRSAREARGEPARNGIPCLLYTSPSPRD